MKSTLIVLLLAWSVTFFGQGNPKQYVGLALGPSFPTGEYSKMEIADSTSGFASTGITIEFSYSYRFTHNFGLEAIVNYGTNNFDATNYSNQLTLTHPDYNNTIEVSKNWNCGGILVGPFLTFPLSEKLSWDIRGLFGMYSAYSPAITIYTINTITQEKADYVRNQASAVSFGYLFGTGFKYKLPNYYLLLFGEYVSSPLKFDNASGWDWLDEPYMTTFSQDISYITVTLGIGYYF